MLLEPPETRLGVQADFQKVWELRSSSGGCDPKCGWQGEIPLETTGKIIGRYEKQMENPWKSHSLWK